MEELQKLIDSLLEEQKTNGKKLAPPVAKTPLIVESPTDRQLQRPVATPLAPPGPQPSTPPKKAFSVIYKCYRAPPLIFSSLSCFILFGVLCLCFILVPPKCISIEVSDEHGYISHRVNMFGCILMASFAAIVTVIVSYLISRKTTCVPQNVAPLSYHHTHP